MGGSTHLSSGGVHPVGMPIGPVCSHVVSEPVMLLTDCCLCMNERLSMHGPSSSCPPRQLVDAAGFLAGPRADALVNMTPEQAVQRFLDQLDEIFGTPDNPKPASSSYVKAHVFDWAREPWVGGAYTFPTHGAEEGDRQALAAPVAGTLFFAGGCGVQNCLFMANIVIMCRMLLIPRKIITRCRSAT